MNKLSLLSSNRIDFTSLFSMPGFEVQKIIGTTYSLSYETLLMLILGATYGPGADAALEHHSGKISPAAIFAAIKNMRGKLKVYCQTDKCDINLSGGGDENILRIKSLLDEFIEPVPMIKAGDSFSSFHPKVWQIFFKPVSPETATCRQRFIVTSRNLTSNRDFDAAAVFEFSGESEIPQALDITNFNQNDFPIAGKIISGEDAEKCHSVVSPFLDAGLLKKLTPENKMNIFSLRSEINKVWKQDAGLLEKYNFFCFNPALENSSGESSHSSIHAKLYISDTSVIIGSSNFTRRGWKHNREFNIKLESGIPAETLLEQFGIEKNGGYGKGMFVPYTPPGDPDEVRDDDKDTLLQQLAGLVLEAVWEKDRLSLKIENPLNADLNGILWRPLWADAWKKEELTWEMSAADACGIFLCRVPGQPDIQMLAALAGKEELWDKRYAAERRKLPLTDELDYRMLCAETPAELYGRDVPLKRSGGGAGGSYTPPKPPVLERLLKMDPVQREKFFAGEIEERSDDPLGLVQAFRELKQFFGISGEIK